MLYRLQVGFVGALVAMQVGCTKHTGHVYGVEDVTTPQSDQNCAWVSAVEQLETKLFGLTVSEKSTPVTAQLFYCCADSTAGAGGKSSAACDRADWSKRPGLGHGQSAATSSSSEGNAVSKAKAAAAVAAQKAQAAQAAAAARAKSAKSAASSSTAQQSQPADAGTNAKVASASQSKAPDIAPPAAEEAAELVLECGQTHSVFVSGDGTQIVAMDMSNSKWRVVDGPSKVTQFASIVNTSVKGEIEICAGSDGNRYARTKGENGYVSLRVE